MFHTTGFGKCALFCIASALSLVMIRPSFAAADQRATATAPAAADAATSPVAHALNKPDLGAFFDGMIPLQLERGDIAGATVLVMKDGETLLQKGYGFSDLKAKKAVDPESSMFRLASISKLFTWIAVMQLVEQGKLDLDVGVDRYLDFPIGTNSGFDQPITLRNLMTHTSGFEETVRNIIVTDSEHYLDLRDFLIQNQPNRLFAPGSIAAYSNYAVGLGSYIVQRVSGDAFEDYIAQHIFSPLGMAHSTFHQPPQEALKDLPAEGYRASSSDPAIGFERFSPVGAGGISSTAADMGRFGQALLNGGELDGHRILKQESLAAMWKPQFRADDRLPPIGLGFYQVWRNQLKWIGHQGDLVAFHSLFFVEPQQKLVLFISYNSSGSASKTRTELLNAFSDRYFPAQLEQPFINGRQGGLKEIEGTYQATRRAESTPLKLLALFGQAHATVDKDGVLHVDKMKDLRGHPFGWKPTGKDFWQQVDDQNKLLAIRAADGQIERLAGAFTAAQWQRVPWYEEDRVVYSMLGASLLVGVSVLFISILRLARRYIFRSTQPLPPPNRVPLSILSTASAIVWTLLFAALAVVFAIGMDEDSLPPTSAWDTYFLVGDVLCGIAIGLSVFAVWSALRIWRRPGTSTISQVKFTLVAFAGVYLSWFAIHWHVITPIHRL
jgi:CubicO group peptidase (beta-lactamase class C family)